MSAMMGNASNAIGLSVLAVILAGCGEQPIRYPVAGQVLVDGAPLSAGFIRFVPEAGRPSTGEILPDGTFTLREASLSPGPPPKGIAPGKYRVAVAAAQVINEDAGEVEWLAPSKYADFRTSEISVEIDGPEDELVFDLTWNGDGAPSAVENHDKASETSNDAPDEQGASSK
jgi:hypothetical protein